MVDLCNINRPFIIQIVFSDGNIRQACCAEKKVRIGRRSEVEIGLPDPDVSRYHAEIISKDAHFTLIDRDSTNGILLNGKKTPQGELKKGDEIEIGRNRLTFEPDLTKNQEARICIECGKEYLNRGRVDLAAEAFQRSLQAQPDNPKGYLLLARAYLEQKRFDTAELMIERLNAVAPDQPDAYYLKGLIEDRQGHWVAAKENYAKCLQLKANYDAAKKKLAVLAEKSGIYEKLNTLVQLYTKDLTASLTEHWAILESGPFRIKFRLAENMHDIQKVVRTLYRAHQKIGDKLDFFADHVPVELYSSFLEFAQRIGGRNNENFARWAAGVTGDAIVVNMQPDILKDPPFLYMILTHEYVHFLLHAITRGNCPYWLGEGLAQYESQSLSRDSLRILDSAVKGDFWLPLEFLEGHFEHLEEPAVIKLAYAQSYSVVEYIIEMHGIKWLKKVLQNLSQRQRPADALEYLGKGYPDLENGWLQWLQDRGEINSWRESSLYSNGQREVK